MMAGQELGAELHDRVIGSMSALILDMELFKREQYNRRSVQTSITSFQESMVATLGELRDVVSRLQGGSPAGFSEGLMEAVRRGPLADLHRQTGAATKILISPQFPRRLDTFIEIQLYRVIEQALNNAAVHSGAQNVTVSFRVAEKCLVVQVIDDGRGYSWSTRCAGQGITGMEHRAQLMGGVLEFDHRVGGGTVVRVRVPKKVQS
jgi:two-component system sensor histidine kinase DegS